MTPIDAEPVSKDEHRQTPVPTVWRNTLTQIVSAFARGDYTLTRGIDGVLPVSNELALNIANNIRGYGCGELTELPDGAWRTSVCHWMDGFWDVLVDLYTIEEGASDLVLAVRVREEISRYSFDIRLVYVP